MLDGVLVPKEREAAKSNQDGIECDHSCKTLFQSFHVATTEVLDAVSVVSLFCFVSGPIADLSVDSRVFFSVGIDCWRIDRVAICFRCSPDCLLTAISQILPPSFKSGGLLRGEFMNRCVHIALNSFIASTNENFGFVNAIVNAVVAVERVDVQVLTHRDRLLPSNDILQRLATLCSQLLHQRLQVMKNVDVSYNETIRLPALYYAPTERSARSTAASSTFESPQKETRKTELSFVTPEKS